MANDIPKTYAEFKQRFAQTPQGQQILKLSTSEQAEKSFNKAYSDFSAAAGKPAVTQRSVATATGKPKQSGIAGLIANDKTPPVVNEIDPNQPAIGTPEAQGSRLSQILSGGADLESSKSALQSLGFENPSKGQGILDAIISGIAGIGASAAHDPDSANQIQQGLMARQSGREAKKSAFQNALMSLAGPKNKPNLLKEFEGYSQLSPEMQLKMQEFLRAKGTSNPLLAALAGKI